MTNYSKLVGIHNNKVSELFSYYDDSVTINYKPVRSGTASDYDSFFNESTDSTDPTNISVNETTPNSVTIAGKFHTDLYSNRINSNNDEQQTYIGLFEQSDALFTCLYSNAVKDVNTGVTYFENSDYITADKDNEKYEVIGIKKRGMKDIYVVDVFLKRTNK